MEEINKLNQSYVPALPTDEEEIKVALKLNQSYVPIIVPALPSN